MIRKNCWEIKQCGRQLGGAKVEELGICPAAWPNEYDGVNQGKQGGRFCWAVAGTLCEGKVQSTFAKKFMNCLKCDFLKQVQVEEDRFFTLRKKDVKKKPSV